ncbi:MAG: hypothetical protein FVQ77_02295 [Cytophagales bacterium]|nr:hypothetical protein [Cytophagales bacterium]
MLKNIRTKFYLITAIALFFTITSSAQRYRYAKQEWGVGVRLGEPMGLSIKQYARLSCLELNVGISSWISGVFGIGGQFNYIMQRNMNFNELPELDWYWGGGVMVGFFEGSFDVGPDALVGVEYNFKNGKKYPFAIFVDFGLFLDVTGPDYVPRLIAGMGIRYNFY